MSIISALKQQNSSIDDLAALPQALIMQMAQKKQISEEMLAPILARKAELAEAFSRQQVLQKAGQTPPTVIEQLMARNSEAENDVAPATEEAGVAQLPIPERSYAGGGIIAFDDGGEVDEYGDDSYDERLRMSRMQSFGTPVEDLYAMLKRGANKVKDMVPDFDAMKTKATQYTMPDSKGSSHPLQDKAVAAANKVGLDPRLMLHALNKESGGLKDPATAQSKAGAYGPMQLMAATAKDLGVDRKDVDQNIYGGAMYLKQMMDKYKDPQLALAAYNAGPGRVDRALKSDMGLASLPRETRNYIVGLAGGGEVRGFYEGDYVDPMGSAPLITDPEMGSYQSIVPGSPENLLANKQITPDQYKEIKTKQEAAKAPPTKAKEDAKPDLQSTFEDFTRRQQSNPERDVFAEMIARNAAQRDEMKKSSAEDRNLALLAAGLGMMGGTSPYAFTNMGQGAMKGVEYLGASKAKRAAELNALNKADTEALYYGAETSRKNQTLRSLEAERAIDNLAAYDAKLRKNYFMEGVAPTPKQLEAYENAKRNDAIYSRLSRNAGVYSQVPNQKRTIDFSTIR